MSNGSVTFASTAGGILALGTPANASTSPIGGFGGFLGPYLTGRMRDATHSYAGGLYAIGGLAVCAALLAMQAPASRSSATPAD